MKTEIKYIGYIPDAEWEHFKWSVRINDEYFEYKTGVGHCTKFFSRDGTLNKKPNSEKVHCISDIGFSAWVHVPKIDQILHCLFLDARCGEESFDSFCDDFGYSNDSLKALDIYRECMDINRRLQKALGKDFKSERKRIEDNENN